MELNEAEIQVTNESRELLVSLDEKQKELTEYQTNIVDIKMYASDLQTFIAVKQIEKQVDTLVTLVFIFCFRFSCIFSTDMGGDSSATIIWACYPFFEQKPSHKALLQQLLLQTFECWC
jgi:hypothetical protein